MAAKQKPEEQDEASKDPLVLSLSQHEALSEDEKTEFRRQGGTVSNQP